MTMPRLLPLSNPSQLTLFRQGTLAPLGLDADLAMLRPVPTLPDTSLPWSLDAGPGGFSAKMWCHQMLRTSRPGWTCSDTTALLSQRTVQLTRLSPGKGISLSEVLRKQCPGSSAKWASDKALMGLLRRAAGALRSHNRQRPVLLRVPGKAWESVRVSCGSPHKGSSAISVSMKPNGCKASLAAGLLDFLRGVVSRCSGTHGQSPSLPASPKQ